MVVECSHCGNVQEGSFPFPFHCQSCGHISYIKSFTHETQLELRDRLSAKERNLRKNPEPPIFHMSAEEREERRRNGFSDSD